MLGAVTLALSLAFPWYEGVLLDGFRGASDMQVHSAWRAFSFIDLALLGCAILAGGVTVGRLTGRVDPTVGPVVIVIGVVAVSLVLYRMLVQPDVAPLLQLRWGAFAALGAAVAVLAAGVVVERGS